MPPKPLEKAVNKRKIMKDLVEGKTQTKIAQELAVSPSAITKFKQRHEAELAGLYEDVESVTARLILRSKERRLAKLHEYIDIADSHVIERGGFMARDVKWIGAGPSGREVEVERFDAGMFNALRGALDDIAAEEGARPRGQVQVNIDNREIRVYDVGAEGETLRTPRTPST